MGKNPWRPLSNPDAAERFKGFVICTTPYMLCLRSPTSPETRFIAALSMKPRKALRSILLDAAKVLAKALLQDTSMSQDGATAAVPRRQMSIVMEAWVGSEVPARDRLQRASAGFRRALLGQQKTILLVELFVW